MLDPADSTKKGKPIDFSVDFNCIIEKEDKFKKSLKTAVTSACVTNSAWV